MAQQPSEAEMLLQKQICRRRQRSEADMEKKKAEKRKRDAARMREKRKIQKANPKLAEQARAYYRRYQQQYRDRQRADPILADRAREYQRRQQQLYRERVRADPELAKRAGLKHRPNQEQRRFVERQRTALGSAYNDLFFPPSSIVRTHNQLHHTQRAQSQTPSAESSNILAFKPDGRLISFDEAENTSKKILVRKTLLPKKNVMVVADNHSVKKRRFTLEELALLDGSELVNLFATKVKILSSAKFSMRCEMVKSCPLIIACRSEDDCRTMMGLHMKNHVLNITKSYSANAGPSSNFNCARTSSVTETKQVGSSNATSAGCQSHMKPVPSRSISYPPQKGNSTVSNVQSDSHVRGSCSAPLNTSFGAGVPLGSLVWKYSPITVTTQPQQNLLGNDPKRLLNSCDVRAGMSTNMKIMANSASSISTIPFLLQMHIEPTQLPNREELPNLPAQPVPVPICKQKLMLSNGNHLRKHKETSAIAQNATLLLLPLARLLSQCAVMSSSKCKNKGKALKQVSSATKTGKPPYGVVGLCKNLSNGSEKSSSPPILNQMPFIAKTSLDESAVPIGQSHLSDALQVQTSPESDCPPPFEVKITLPRLFDLTKHVIMNNPLLSHIDLHKIFPGQGSENPDASKSLAAEIVQSKLPNEIEPLHHLDSLPNSVIPNSSTELEMKNAESSCNDSDNNSMDSKQSLLSILGLKNADHTLSSRKQKQSQAPFARLQKKKVECASLSVSCENSSSTCKSSVISQPPVLRQSGDYCLSSNSKNSNDLKSANSKKRVGDEVIWYETPSNSKTLLPRAAANSSEQHENEFEAQISCHLPKQSEKFLSLESRVMPGRQARKMLCVKIPNNIWKNCPDERANRKEKEVLVNGKVVNIKQEPDFDMGEPISKISQSDFGQYAKRCKKTEEIMLQPPSDDIEDFFGDLDGGERTDSETETDYRRGDTSSMEESFGPNTKSSSKTTITNTNVGGLVASDNAAIKERAREYVRRLLELINAKRRIESSGEKWPGLPESYNFCKLCSQELSNLDQMYIHYMIHAGEKLSPCIERSNSCLYTPPSSRFSNGKAHTTSNAKSNYSC